MKHRAVIVLVSSTITLLLVLYIGFASSGADLEDGGLVNDGVYTSDSKNLAPSTSVAEPATLESSEMNYVGMVSDEPIVSRPCFQEIPTTDCTNELRASIPKKAVPDYIGLTYGELFGGVSIQSTAAALQCISVIDESCDTSLMARVAIASRLCKPVSHQQFFEAYNSYVAKLDSDKYLKHDLYHSLRNRADDGFLAKLWLVGECSKVSTAVGKVSKKSSYALLIVAAEAGEPIAQKQYVRSIAKQDDADWSRATAVIDNLVGEQPGEGLIQKAMLELYQHQRGDAYNHPERTRQRYLNAAIYLRAAQIVEEGIELPYEVTIIESRFRHYVGVDKYSEIEHGARAIVEALTRNG